ncbi:anhydro-N-acetylmuramic acid kinase [Algoriphagus aestuariicola]|uniref:Anhydro-N-acetylmuramic acid kinase n=1 Tax=Algoriphagus aestuariicola TaxID=1852016 RepID=A0ABS3BTW4_9BACT|nr:anhydro-N-acetylmuramic acid kinase [Algoriphagus aestuariicola]MBN7802264.1 anhydro-N-acetylmuramic acid kinase [Algoriphagus aestuariicola]
MSPEKYSLIGLMSGTSGDGLDVAYVHFDHQSDWAFEIVQAKTFAFPSELGSMLLRAHTLSGLELSQLDVDFGKWMGAKVRDFCREFQIKPLAIASHGHTVFHQPSKGLSLQIGNGWALHQACGQKVINDFRMLDVQLGGQGAPLVPIGDRLLFPQVDFCLNLGGIANISMEQDGRRIAFDTCPFNLLLNAEAMHLGKPFDSGGEIARSGEVNLTLFEALNQLPFYQVSSAKSLGREEMEGDFIPLINQYNLAPKDILRTLVEHYAYQIASVIRNSTNNEAPSVLITGGGAYNGFFVERLEHYLGKKWQMFDANPELIEFKEAIIFAFLGVLRLRGETNCLASVTGASRDSCGGTIYG